MRLRKWLIKKLGAYTQAEYDEALGDRSDFEVHRLGHLVVLQDRRYKDAQRTMCEQDAALAEMQHELFVARRAAGLPT